MAVAHDDKKHFHIQIRVKASDVFRNNFAGKINRQTSDAAPDKSAPTPAGKWRQVAQIANMRSQSARVS